MVHPDQTVRPVRPVLTALPALAALPGRTVHTGHGVDPDLTTLITIDSGAAEPGFLVQR